MHSIVCQCQALDEEYYILQQQIQDLLDNLSQVSLEFVQSKLSFLQKYSDGLKTTQLDARQHRNNQIRNLIEYVKLHTRSKVKSAVNSPANRKHYPKYSLNENAFQSTPSAFIIQTHGDHDSDKKLQQKKILSDLIIKQRKDNNNSKESTFLLLQKAMRLLESKQSLYQDEFDKLNKEYKKIQQKNKFLVAKSNLMSKSSQIKENIHTLMVSQQSFQSFLNSVI
ncbi:hypothetical protein pb186bvf_006619 [Paramecium bursaria]